MRFRRLLVAIGLLSAFTPHVGNAQDAAELSKQRASVFDAQRIILTILRSPKSPVADRIEGVGASYEGRTAHLVIFAVRSDTRPADEVGTDAELSEELSMFRGVLQTASTLLPDDVTFDQPEVIFTEPIQPFVALGSSTSNRSGCFEGTVGVAVYDKDDPTIRGYVTCNHVAAGEPPLLCPNGEGAKQVVPATAMMMDCHGGHKVGRVLRRHPISSIPSIGNEADAAFVQTDHPVDLTGCQGLIHATQDYYKFGEMPDTPLRKCGARTHYTETRGWDRVIPDVLISIPFMPCGMTATFVHQIAVVSKQFARAGDSGAWVVDPGGKGVGMIFAGDEEKVTFINPASEVLGKLRVEIAP